MKIVIDLDDNELISISEDINSVNYTPAEHLDVEWIEIGITPTYSDGHQTYWLHVWLEPDKITTPHRLEIIK